MGVHPFPLVCAGMRLLCFCPLAKHWKGDVAGWGGALARKQGLRSRAAAGFAIGAINDHDSHDTNGGGVEKQVGRAPRTNARGMCP